MNTSCFLITKLPLTPRAFPTAKRISTCVEPQMSLRLPNFNPFKAFRFGSSGSFNFGGGSSFQPPSGNNRGGSGRTPGDTGGGAADDKNPFAKIWGAYVATLDKNPITTKAFTSLIGFFLGDLIAQKFLGEKGADIDKWRLVRMASFGFLIHGPSGHYFYSALDRLIVGKTPLKVASKVAVDQLLWAPVFTVLFFGYLGFAERKNATEVKDKIKNDLWAGVSASWKFWPLAHTINFAVVPTSQRLLYINCLQVGYNVILSILGNK